LDLDNYLAGLLYLVAQGQQQQIAEQQHKTFAIYPLYLAIARLDA
jgi:hypothetical protein